MVLIQIYSLLAVFYKFVSPIHEVLNIDNKYYPFKLSITLSSQL